MDFNEIKKYLPQYLSEEESRNLFSELKSFPDNVDSRFYSLSSTIDSKILYQGDGINNISVFQLPDTRTKISESIVLSNTCDIDLNNKRIIDSRVLLSQIIDLKKLERSLLRASFDENRVKTYINSVKRQEITNVFYLPKCSTIEESIVLFDYTNSYNNTYIERENLSSTRLFSLSNFGFYIFLVKVSIHFTRIKEGVLRM